MANVRNNHYGRLTVAGVAVRPGATVAVPNWNPDLASPAEKTLFEQKLLEIVDPAVEDKPAEKKAKG